MPERIQLRRKKGFNLQEVSRAANGLPCVKVDRTTKWGNPFITGKHGTRAECVDLYRNIIALGGACLVMGNPEEQKAAIEHMAANYRQLRGKNLACWCPLTDQDGNRVPCHADVLLELANK